MSRTILKQGLINNSAIIILKASSNNNSSSRGLFKCIKMKRKCLSVMAFSDLIVKHRWIWCNPLISQQQIKVKSSKANEEIEEEDQY
jgi:hypothetical protein